MSREVETISPDAPLSQAVQKMSARHIRRLIVTNNEEVVGIVCKPDLIEAYPHHLNPFSVLEIEDPAASNKIETIMKGPPITVDANAPIEEAADLMTKHHIGSLPVLDHGNLVGIITESDVFRAFCGLLGGDADAVRVTFDVTEAENILTFLAATIKTHGVELLSFISYHHDGRRLAAVRVRGGEIQSFIDALWESDHLVVNIVRSKSDEGASPGSEIAE